MRSGTFPSESNWSLAPCDLHALPARVSALAHQGRENRADCQESDVSSPAASRSRVYRVGSQRRAPTDRARKHTRCEQVFVGETPRSLYGGNWTRLFIGVSLMILQNMSGINALNYYSATIFTSIGFKGTSAGLLATGVFGLVKAFATLFFMIFGIERLGRRRSMLMALLERWLRCSILRVT